MATSSFTTNVLSTRFKNWFAPRPQSDSELAKVTTPNDVDNTLCFSFEKHGDYQAFIESVEFPQFQAYYEADIDCLQQLACAQTSMKSAEIKETLRNFKEHLFREDVPNQWIISLPANSYRAMAYGEIRVKLRTVIWHLEHNNLLTSSLKSQLITELVSGLDNCIGRVESNIANALQLITQDRQSFEWRIQNIRQTFAQQIAIEFVRGYKNSDGSTLGAGYHVHIVNSLLNQVAAQYDLKKSQESGLHFGQARMTQSLCNKFATCVKEKLTDEAVYQFIIDSYTQEFMNIYIETVITPQNKTFENEYHSEFLVGNCRENFIKKLEAEIFPILRSFSNDPSFGLTNLLNCEVGCLPISTLQLRNSLSAALARGMVTQKHKKGVITFCVQRQRGVSVIRTDLVIAENYYSWLEVDGSPKLATYKDLPLISTIKCRPQVTEILLEQVLKGASTQSVDSDDLYQCISSCKDTTFLLPYENALRRPLLNISATVAANIHTEKSNQFIDFICETIGDVPQVASDLIKWKLEKNLPLTLRQAVVLSGHFKPNETGRETNCRIDSEIDSETRIESELVILIKEKLAKFEKDNVEFLYSIAIINDNTELLTLLLNTHPNNVVGDYYSCLTPQKKLLSSNLLELAFYAKSNACFDLLLARADIKIEPEKKIRRFKKPFSHHVLLNDENIAKQLIMSPKIDFTILNDSGETLLTVAMKNEAFACVVKQRMQTIFTEHCEQSISASEPTITQKDIVAYNKMNVSCKVAMVINVMQRQRDFSQIYPLICYFLTEEGANSEEEHNIKILFHFWWQNLSNDRQQQAVRFLIRHPDLNLYALERLNLNANILEINQIILAVKAKQRIALSKQDICTLESQYETMSEDIHAYSLTEPYFQKLLSLAIVKNNSLLIRTLLTNKSVMKYQDTFPVRNGGSTCYQICTPLEYALLHGSVATFELIISLRPEDINSVTLCMLKSPDFFCNNMVYIDILMNNPRFDPTLQHTNGNTFLHMVLAGKHDETVRELLRREPFVNIFSVNDQYICCLERLNTVLSTQDIHELIRTRARADWEIGLQLTKTECVSSFANQLWLLNSCCYKCDSPDERANLFKVYDLIRDTFNKVAFSISQQNSVKLVLLAHFQDKQEVFPAAFRLIQRF
ncbi:MAG: hypothetical protein HAW66_00435 [Shewanella sp.]|nr:hypothetical protein [Shewanella sp.]